MGYLAYTNAALVLVLAVMVLRLRYRISDAESRGDDIVKSVNRHSKEVSDHDYRLRRLCARFPEPEINNDGHKYVLKEVN